MGPTVGWNSLLIELFWPKLCSNGSRKGWTRLWPAGLNWHFGAETDLFNFQCEWLKKPRKGDLSELKSTTFPLGSLPRIPIEACALGTRLGNRSVFILDPRLSCHRWKFQDLAGRKEETSLIGCSSYTASTEETNFRMWKVGRFWKMLE